MEDRGRSCHQNIKDLLSNDIILMKKKFRFKHQGLTIPAILVVVVGVVVVVAVGFCPRPTYKPTDSKMRRSKSKEAKATMFFLLQFILFCAISSDSGGLINQ